MRVTVGATAVVQGGNYLGDRNNLTTAAGLVAIVGGGCLIIGLVTAFAAAAISILAGAIAGSLIPPPSQPPSGAVFVATVAASLVFLGPGALSADRRLFGRREIIIPRAQPPRSGATGTLSE